MKTLLVVQARAASTRLPGKVLLPIAGRTLLERMLERLSHANAVDATVVATSTHSGDDAVAEASRRAGVDCFRGHPTDLLDRHVQAARREHADVVVKVPSDCPLIDAAVVDRVIRAHLAGGADYTSNLHPESYPDGMDVEAMSVDALEAAYSEATAPHEREHTTPFLWDRPDRFGVRNVVWEAGRNVSRTHRIVVDYPKDYEVVRTVFEALWSPAGPPFTVGDIVSFLDSNDAIRKLNESHAWSQWYRRDGIALRTVDTDAAEMRT